MCLVRNLPISNITPRILRVGFTLISILLTKRSCLYVDEPRIIACVVEFLVESKFYSNLVENMYKFLLTMNCRAKDKGLELYPVASLAYSFSTMFRTLQFTSFIYLLNNNGPSRDLWGTPAMTHFLSEQILRIAMYVSY